MLPRAFDWSDCHLYAFRKDGEDLAASPDYEPFGDDPEVPSAADVKIGALLRKGGSRGAYEYDFGDSWLHDIVVEAVRNESGDEPWLLGGELAGPPEDCGGVPGYERCAEVVRAGVDPFGEDPEELLTWLDGWTPDAFTLPPPAIQSVNIDGVEIAVDHEKLEDGAIALLCMTLHGARAWKSLDWDLMNRLHERGWILDPKGKAKSVVVTEEGARRAQVAMATLFGRSARGVKRRG